MLTDAEIAAFWRACDEVGEPWHAIFKLLLLSGCRLNEIARLEWSEVGDDAITLPGSRTKNGKPHIVPLSGLARSILDRVPRIAGCMYVFSTNGRRPPSGSSRAKLKLDDHMQPTSPWRLHDLRRTAVTGMAEIGILPHVVEAVVNHVSGSKGGIAGVYNRHNYPAEKRDALERWALHVAGIVAGGNVVPIRRVQ